MDKTTRHVSRPQQHAACPRCQTPRFLDQRKLVCPACTRFTQRARFVYVLTGKAVIR